MMEYSIDRIHRSKYHTGPKHQNNLMKNNFDKTKKKKLKENYTLQEYAGVDPTLSKAQ